MQTPQTLPLEMVRERTPTDPGKSSLMETANKMNNIVFLQYF